VLTRSDARRVADLFLDRLAALEQRIGAELGRPLEARSSTEQLLLDVGRELWNLVTQQLIPLVDPRALARALALALGSGPVDELGVDTARADAVRDLMRPLLRAWLGVGRGEPLELPAEGGVLVTFNRSACPLPTDAVVLWTEIARHVAVGRRVHALWDRSMFGTPFVGGWLERLGIFAATTENARVLLARGAVVIAFPEGAAASTKTYDRRYRLTPFDDDFLFEAAVDTDASVVPACVIGNEESYPLIDRVRGVPVTPFFPLTGAFGMLPLPLAWRIRVGSPVAHPALSGDDPSSEEISGLADAVRARMQAMLGEAIAARESIVGG
jgi:1-acyl-sn-glycerol-3-phosphate acyltransferase